MRITCSKTSPSAKAMACSNRLIASDINLLSPVQDRDKLGARPDLDSEAFRQGLGLFDRLPVISGFNRLSGRRDAVKTTPAPYTSLLA